MQPKNPAASSRFTAQIPSLLEMQDKVYSSPSEMEISLKALLSILGRRSSSKSEIPSYIIDTVEVEFSPDRSVESVWADHRKSRLVILAPKNRNESLESIEFRRRQYLLDFSTVLDELKTRALTQAYRTLDDSARKQLTKDFKISLKKYKSK